MELNLRCTLCGNEYYSAAPDEVARREPCSCGGQLAPVGSALARQPLAEAVREATGQRRFKRLSDRLTRRR
jgi:hypothetical protein